MVVLMGKSSINGPFSLAMLNNQMVITSCSTSATSGTSLLDLLADSYDVGFYFNAGVLVFRPSKSDFSAMMGWLHRQDAQTTPALQILG